jgi:glycosyltransferase involved in cell wall biosynthesis
LKIVHVTNSLGPGGMERQLVDLMAGLIDQGAFTIDLVMLSHDVHYSSLYDMDIKIHYVPRRYRKDLTVFVRLYNLFRTIRPDIIHVWQSMNAVYSLPSSVLLGIPMVNGMIRIAPDRLDFTNWSRSWFTSIFSQKVVSNSLAGLKSYKVKMKKGVCIYNGFDFNRTKAIENSIHVREKIGLGDVLIIGMVASFSDKKDHRTILLAAQNILRSRSDVGFVFVGDGPMLEESRQLVEERFRDKVKFLGNRSDVESLVNVFDIGVLSTFTEGISNSIMEYMAFEKPVVATEGGGTKEIVKDGETGLLVKKWDPVDMADKLLMLINNKELRTAMGKAGKRYLMENFSYGAMINSYISLYKSLIRKEG